jgi:IclR family pca regulon transcriptional regulator
MPVAEPDRSVSRRGDPQFMTSFARGLLVIHAFSCLRRERTIAKISRITGLSRAAVRRCLYTLCELGYVRREGRTFRLLPRVLALGHIAMLPTDVVSGSASGGRSGSKPASGHLPTA